MIRETVFAADVVAPPLRRAYRKERKTMTQEDGGQAVVTIYTESKTNVGIDIYACIRCYKETREGESAELLRQSAPFVLARQYDARQVVIGSVFETLRNVREQIGQLIESAAQRTERLNGPLPDETRAVEYDRYEREIKNNIVLISCLLRNVFEIFPRLAQSADLPMFDYEKRLAGRVKMKALMDQVVHNRYMHLHNEYITDIFSNKPPTGTPIAEKFMGYRFKFSEFLDIARQTIEEVSVKDIATRLRSGMHSLNIDTRHHEMVFLLQNVASFSRLLEALIPSGKNPLFKMLYADAVVPKAVIDRAGSREIVQTCKFHPPTVRMGDRVDPGKKTIVVSVRGQFEYAVDGVEIHRESADREKELEYGEFFNHVIAAGGDESLLEMGDRIEQFRSQAVTTS